MTVIERVSAASERAFVRLPDSLQPLARKWYYRLHPSLSWPKRKQYLEATEMYVDEFFDSREEFDAYRAEFFDGRITDICGQAHEEMNGVQFYDSHRNECAKLYALIRKHRPETLVETGVHSGVSTTSILLGLDANGTGTLHSLDPGGEIWTSDGETDIPETEASFYERGRPSCTEEDSHVLPEGKDAGWIVPADLEDRWELSTGRSRRALPSVLEDAGEVDVFVHDSEHSTTGMLFEFELAWEHLAPGGVLLSQHVDQNDAFETFTAERDCTHGIAAFEYDGRYATFDYDEPCQMGYVIKE